MHSEQASTMRVRRPKQLTVRFIEGGRNHTEDTAIHCSSQSHAEMMTHSRLFFTFWRRTAPNTTGRLNGLPDSTASLAGCFKRAGDAGKMTKANDTMNRMARAATITGNGNQACKLSRFRLGARGASSK